MQTSTIGSIQWLSIPLPPNGAPVEVNNRHCDRTILDAVGLVISTEIFVCSPGDNDAT